MEERIQKLIARAGIASRRAAEELITTKQVTVNGRVANLGDKADPEVDDIRVQGRKLAFNERPRYIMMYKKRGVVSSNESQGDRDTVVEVVRAKERLYPVGRLDIDSDGLILLTNDGELANRLTHPRYGVEKTYKVLVTGKPNRETLEAWRNGIVLEGERTLPAQVRVLSGTDSEHTTLQIIMHEGKKRQIRRVAEALGHPVIRLTRTAIGPISLGHLKPGQFRDLSPAEIKILKDLTQPKRTPKPRKPRPNDR